MKWHLLVFTEVRSRPRKKLILLVRLIQKMQNEKRFLVPKFRGPVYWGKQITRVRHKDSGRMGKNGKCERIHGQ